MTSRRAKQPLMKMNANKDEDYYLREREKARAAAAERERASVQARGARVTINYHSFHLISVTNIISSTKDVF